MAFWRFLKILLAATMLFILINFFLSNLDPQTGGSLAQEISFRFNLPPYWELRSVPFPVGYLLLASFVLGMLLAAMMGALSASGYRKKQKLKDKEVKELKREIIELKNRLEIVRETEKIYGSSLISPTAEEKMQAEE